MVAEYVRDEQGDFGDNPIEVNNSHEIGDLTQVKEKKTLLPPAKDVKLQVTEASVIYQAEGKIEKLRLNLKLVDGIDGKFANMKVLADTYIWADLNYYTKEWFQDQQHLVEIKKWLQGVVKKDGTKTEPVFSVSNPTGSVDDKMCEELKGQFCLGTIKQIPPQDGYDAKNEAVYLKPVSAESMV